MIERAGIELLTAAGIGVGVGVVLTAAVAALIGRRRTAVRLIRWESRFHALEAELAGTRLDHARALAEKGSLGSDLAVLNETLAILRGELESHRVAVDEAVRARELSARRAEAAVDELAHSRLELEEAVAARDELRARIRELKPLTDQRTALAGRVGDLGRAMAEIESDRTRLALLVETLQHQLRQALDSTRQEQDRLEAGRSLMSTQLRDRQRQLEEGRRTVERLNAELAEARAKLATEGARVAEADAALRASDLRHQEELAALSAEHGGIAAQLERLEPLRRQLADREELIRSIARERDDAATALVRRERELQSEVERLTTSLAEATRRVAQARDRDGRIAELEARLAAALKERDHHRAGEQQARAQVASQAAEIRDRDLRFRTLLDDRRAMVESAHDEASRLRAEVNRLRQGDPTGSGPVDVAEPALNDLTGGKSPGPALSALTGGKAPAPAPQGSNGGNGGAHPPPADPAGPDDLQRIVGIGPAIARALRSRGVLTFRQIAAWSDDDIERYAGDLGAFKSRIRRDRWVEQARREHEQAYGERLDR